MYSLNNLIFVNGTSLVRVLVVVKRRHRRLKQRVVRLYRLSSPPAAPGDTTWGSPRHWRTSPAAGARPPPAEDSGSMQAEFNPNYTSLELGLGLAAIEHGLNEIPPGCLVVTR